MYNIYVHKCIYIYIFIYVYIYVYMYIIYNMCVYIFIHVEALERSSVVLSVPTLQILLVPQVAPPKARISIHVHIDR